MIQLQDIFIAKPNKRLYSKEDLIGLKIQPNFIKKIAAQLDLDYLENSSLKGNVCFANSKDVRPEFRTVFTKAAIIHYVSIHISTAYFELEKEKISFPNNVSVFFA